MKSTTAVLITAPFLILFVCQATTALAEESDAVTLNNDGGLELSITANRRLQAVDETLALVSVITRENIEEIQVANLLELYCLVKVSDLFITDRIEIAGAFAGLGIDQILLGAKVDDKSTKCVDKNNIFEMKNVIQDILNK